HEGASVGGQRRQARRRRTVKDVVVTGKCRGSRTADRQAIAAVEVAADRQAGTGITDDDGVLGAEAELHIDVDHVGAGGGAGGGDDAAAGNLGKVQAA